MAITTAGTYLNYKTTVGGTYAPLCPITSYPDMGSSPSKLDSTTLEATQYKTNEFGLQELGDLVFEANYDKVKLAEIEALTGVLYLQLQFGTNDGAYEWQGKVKVFANGGAVDEIRKMTVTCSTSTAVEFVPQA